MECPVCEESVSGEQQVCNHCGAVLAETGGADNGDTDEPTVLGVPRNLAATLAYSMTFISGLVVYALVDDTVVRFHAAQSTIVFGGLFTLILLGEVFEIALLAATEPGVAEVVTGVSAVLTLLAFVLWVVLLVKAYRGEQYELPVAGPVAVRYV